MLKPAIHGYSLSTHLWLILVVLLIVSSVCHARDVYKWTSEDGVVIYSDTYQPGAEKVSVTAGKGRASGDTGEDSEQTADAVDGYEEFVIAQPQNDETVRSNEGIVNVGLTLAPTLSPGHQIQIYLDGNKLASDITSTQFSLNQLNRGTHNLQAKVIDAEGKTLISTETISFHLRKASIIEP